MTGDTGNDWGWLGTLWAWLTEGAEAAPRSGPRPAGPPDLAALPDPAGPPDLAAGPLPARAVGPGPGPSLPPGPVGRLAGACDAGDATSARRALDAAVNAGLAPEARRCLATRDAADAPVWLRLLVADAALADDPDAGRGALEALADAEPRDLAAEARLRLGDLLRAAGDLAGARMHYERALALDLDLPRARALADALRTPAGAESGDGRPTLVLPRARLGPAADRYALLRELGRGGAGTVYLAEDVRLGRRVAVKVLHPRPGEAPPARLLAEVQAAVAVAHPGIVRIFDVDPARGVVVMEHLAGGSLRDRLVPGEPVPPEAAAALARGLAEALAVLHRRGVIHGDLKAGNVLFRGGADLSAPVIADFGLAREAGGGRRPAGTLAAMAPEVRAGAAPTPAADVWALGVLLHEVLAGRPPVSPGDLLQGALTPGSLPDAVPEPFRGLITALLARAPADRPPDADAVLALLDGSAG